jgi:hypothetical protein
VSVVSVPVIVPVSVSLGTEVVTNLSFSPSFDSLTVVCVIVTVEEAPVSFAVVTVDLLELASRLFFFCSIVRKLCREKEDYMSIEKKRERGREEYKFSQSKSIVYCDLIRLLSLCPSL